MEQLGPLGYSAPTPYVEPKTNQNNYKYAVPDGANWVEVGYLEPGAFEVTHEPDDTDILDYDSFKITSKTIPVGKFRIEMQQDFQSLLPMVYATWQIGDTKFLFKCTIDVLSYNSAKNFFTEMSVQHSKIMETCPEECKGSLEEQFYQTIVHLYKEVMDPLSPDPIPGPVLDVSREAYRLPGTNKHVTCPRLGCSENGTLYNTIIHLNDKHKWKREKIADWIDDLHEKGIINAEFSPWEEPGQETLI